MTPRPSLPTRDILEALDRYVQLGLIESFATSNPPGHNWTITREGERLVLPGNGWATAWLEGVSAGLDWARTYLADANLGGPTPGEKAAAMADRLHEVHRAHASSRPVDGCVWCEAEERDRRG